MIRYTLSCTNGHSYDSWFQSAEAYDTLAEKKMIQCEICGAQDVSKAMMSPQVMTAPAPLSQAASQDQNALQELRRQVEENADYVGTNFATEVRAMHEGDETYRPIWGEAEVSEAQALLEDNIPVAPLPFIPQRKVS